MAGKKPKLVHPGEVLLRNFIRPLGLSSYGFAKALGVSIPTVTAPMALRISRYFGATAQHWQNLLSSRFATAGHRTAELTICFHEYFSWQSCGCPRNTPCYGWPLSDLVGQNSVAPQW
jgi:addiction module HigA family antidote